MKRVIAVVAFVLFLTFSQNVFALDASGVLGNTSNMNVNTERLNLNVNSGLINGSVGQVDWAKFNNAPQGSVNFGFTGHSQTILNRVIGADPEKIQGIISNPKFDPGQVSKVEFVNLTSTTKQPDIKFEALPQTVLNRQLGGNMPSDIAGKIDMSKFSINNQMTNIGTINIR